MGEEKISDVGATRLCCADLCINHGLLDVDMKIIGATIYEHECELGPCSLAYQGWEKGSPKYRSKI